MSDIEAAHAALRLCLPVMRRTACEYLEGVTIHRDPATITPDEWSEIAPDIRAIWAATEIVGAQPDQQNVDSAWLDSVLAFASDRGEGRP